MSEMTDFFQNQAGECKRLSAQASEKDDREYWLRLAHRWEWLFQQNGGTKTVQPFRPTRSALDKRFAKTVSRLVTRSLKKGKPPTAAAPTGGKARLIRFSASGEARGGGGLGGSTDVDLAKRKAAKLAALKLVWIG